MLQRKCGIGQKHEQRQLKELNLFSMLECVGALKERGYFYFGERVCTGDRKALWTEDEAKSLRVTNDWLERMREEPVTGIQMTFAHILTEEVEYLYIRQEQYEGKETTVIWISDEPGGLEDHAFASGLVKDMPPILEELLQTSEGVLVPGQFYQLDMAALRDKTKGSLFALLYRNNCRQIQEGRIKIKEDIYEENSFGWAGEFVQSNRFTEEDAYLVIAVYIREYERWDYDIMGKETCIWKRVKKDVYMARRNNSMTTAAPWRERPIPLQRLTAAEEITAYLNEFRAMEQIVEDDEYEV